MMVLGIETSTAVCSVGLVHDDGQSAERTIIESHIHSEKLLTMVHEVCRERDFDLSRLDGVAVSIGPGSFTGLRIGLSTAKGLAYALDKPLVGIRTFEALAARVFLLHLTHQRVLLCADAKQGEYYFALYERDRQRMIEVIPVQVGDTGAIRRVVPSESTLLVTDCPDELGKEIPCAEPPLELSPYCRGDMVAFLGVQKLVAGDVADTQELEPMYLKDFVIRPRAKSVS